MGTNSKPVRPFDRNLKRKPSSIRRIVSSIQTAARLSGSTSSAARLHAAARVPGRWGVLGVSNSLIDDFTFHCLDMPWRSLLFLVLGVYFSIAVVFAAAFWFLLAYCGPDCEEFPHLIGDVPRQLSVAELCFWMSVNNLITIGFGNVSPGTTAANILCTAEHFGGIMLSSILLGLVVTKASLPTSKIIFSKVCLITKRNGVPHLLVRVGNTRGNFLLNPEIRISYLKRLVTIEGEVTFSGSRLDYADPPAMAPTVNIAHSIDEHSPLFQLTPTDIIDQEGGIYISISATDSNSLQTVYARQIYRAADIRWDHRFKDMLVQRNNQQFVDFNNLHETVPIAAQEMSEEQANEKSKAMFSSGWRSTGSFREDSEAEADDATAVEGVSKSQPGFKAPWNLPLPGEDTFPTSEPSSSGQGAVCAMQQAREASERADEAFRKRVSMDVDHSVAAQMKRRPSKKLEELAGQEPTGAFDKPG
ncbi:hypothetical protein WJX73_004119 [Symbiochloris irregularis]|uniref:Uncharacterized protein n=1 Tax=Symbiochloris irregularis TaxID=706552 RepID=A0AAW1NY95_9CHLO